MRFNVVQPGPTVKPPKLAWLRSQGLGVICGQATVLLLAIGSVVITMTKDGASKNIAMDDIRPFFDEPAWAHLWFYLLLPLMTLYALNTILATWDSVLRKWKNGIRTASPYAASIIHVGFLIALVAHLIGGLLGTEHRPVMVSREWTELGDGRQARVMALEVESLPDGGIKQVWATMEVRDSDGSVSRPVVSFNGPLSSRLGSDLYLLTKHGRIPVGRPTAGGPQQTQEAVLLRRRHAPGNPWALGSALVMLIGIGLMWRRFV